MLRDSIDYKGTAVGKLFRRFLFPTVMGMVFSAVFVITDGILAEIRKRFLCFRDLYSVKKSYQFRPQFP